MMHVLLMAAQLIVAADGSGQFTTIQACANAVQPGDICLVKAGTYPEHVRTVSGGTDALRVTFKAQGLVTMQGFDLRHPYVTVQGFDITGFAGTYQGLLAVYSTGNSCELLDNVVRDGWLNVYGIYFQTSNGVAADDCLVRGNRLSNLQGMFLTTAGDRHVFEGNTFERMNSRDYIRLFGTGHVFRRNIFREGNSVSGTGNHPDFVQTFGGYGPSEDHLFEENWIENLENPTQLGQVNAGHGGVFNGVLFDNIKNWTFRRNVFVNVWSNLNGGLPGLRFEHNTFYRMATAGQGLVFGGSGTRGMAHGVYLKGNVFLAGGTGSASSGFYGLSGQVLAKESLAVFVTREACSSGCGASWPMATAIHNELIAQGLINPNGIIFQSGRDAQSVNLSAAYDQYEAATFQQLIETRELDALARSTWFSDYNYVGTELFTAKRSSECPPGGTTSFVMRRPYDGETNFCEPHGLNGGDPKLVNLANPLGPDGLPFTADDGLKPRPDSPLCAAGIGAYACDPLTLLEWAHQWLVASTDPAVQAFIRDVLIPELERRQ